MFQLYCMFVHIFFFSSRRRHTISLCDWSSDVCSSDLCRTYGEVRLVHSQGDVMWDESGRPRRMFGTVQDITERKQAEQRLVRSEERRVGKECRSRWWPYPLEKK